MSKDFTVRISAGAAADINFAPWSRLQSDLKAFASIKADITQFFEVFIQGSLNGTWDTGHSMFNSNSAIMAGVTFIFP